LEIGVEEMPPRESPLLAQQLQSAAEELLRARRIGFAAAAVYCTPRRLVLLVKGVEEEQRPATEEVRGPSKRVAFAEDGSPTQAALGFARGQGVSVEELTVRETGDGEYVYAVKRTPGRPTIELLPELLPQLIRKLSPSETMRWDETGLRFIRPIRRLLALFGEEPIEFAYGRLRSQPVTRGHRFLGARDIPIKRIPEYFEKLRDNGVVWDPLERRERIERSLEKIAGQIKAHPALDEALRSEIADNLEHPTAVLGEFPQEFLELPREILETTIVEHQKFVPFAVGDKAAPYFVGYRDGREDETGTVRRGYERVVRARLTDSKFFFEVDRRVTLAERATELKGVIFQEKLGSIWDKVERMRRLGAEIAKRLGHDALLEQIDRTIYLCKADLLTAMVGEFPDLEGIVGGIYARLEGEPEPVWRGIYEHYLPKAAGDPVPETVTGWIAGLADKLDTVVGSLLLGEEPTGSRDPFGLRRKANGVIRIAIERKLDLDFFQLVRDLERLYAFLGERRPLDRVESFFLDRLYLELRDDYGVPYDIADAVIAVRDGNFYRAYRRAVSLNEIREEERFQSLVIAFSRVANITRGQKAHGFDPQRFQEEAERELWRAYLKAEGQIKRLLPQGDYPGIIEKLLDMKDPIDRYFDEVLVMAPDALLRQNRLGLLSKIVELFLTVGDLSKIVVEGESTEKAQAKADADRTG
jgi:glycyl-tRNA synthetase beta chain